MVKPHKRSIARAEEKFGLDKRAEKCIANCAVQSPQPLRLRGSQAKTRHLDVLALHTSKHIEWLLLYRHGLTPVGL